MVLCWTANCKDRWLRKNDRETVGNKLLSKQKIVEIFVTFSIANIKLMKINVFN